MQRDQTVRADAVHGDRPDIRPRIQPIDCPDHVVHAKTEQRAADQEGAEREQVEQAEIRRLDALGTGRCRPRIDRHHDDAGLREALDFAEETERRSGRRAGWPGAARSVSGLSISSARRLLAGPAWDCDRPGHRRRSVAGQRQRRELIAVLRLRSAEGHRDTRRAGYTRRAGQPADVAGEPRLQPAHVTSIRDGRWRRGHARGARACEARRPSHRGTWCRPDRWA